MARKKKEGCNRSLHNKGKIEGFVYNYGVVNRSNQVGSFIYTGGWISQINKDNDLKRDYSLFRVRLRNLTRKLSIELFGDFLVDERTIMLIDYPEEYYGNKNDGGYCGLEWALFFREKIDMTDPIANSKHLEFTKRLVNFMIENDLFEFNCIQKKNRK